jgi:Fe-S-cluster containining protein
MSVTTASVERYEVTLNTPRGPVTTSLDVSTGFVPITAIVPLARRLGERAAAEEIRATDRASAPISCQDGCAACCRMMVPLSPPEAFALREHLNGLPGVERTRFTRRIEETRAALRHAGLLESLVGLANTTKPLSDADMDALNRTYYSLRLPCPFLEQERCSIYEHRPSACRELLVTSPADLCQDLVRNPVEALPVSVRVSTVLGLLWADLTDKVPRLIPLPLAIDWAEQHEQEGRRVWKGGELLDRVLDKIWRLLSQAMGEKAAKSK